ncbi:hypothetical protein HNY73_004903 [Argiope bruennichi]|uniref:Uncharacterized protein n=1 Tax=Argiope bruennichi TaxID=94029 RepID=A0A8T0FQN9_ARGBR|nr:hypothetical protein HNY73_004903 [Argiope bruennichi]
MSNKESFESSATSPIQLSSNVGSKHIKGNDKNPVVSSELLLPNHFQSEDTLILKNKNFSRFPKQIAWKGGRKKSNTPLVLPITWHKSKEGGGEEENKSFLLRKGVRHSKSVLELEMCVA